MAKVNPPVVIDIGTRITMVGFAGEDFPRFVWPTVVGFPVTDTVLDSDASKNYRIGQDAFDSLFQKLVYPVKAGHIEDWDAIRALLDFSFESLGVNPSESNVLMTTLFSTPSKTREQIAQLLFHEFGVAHLYMALRSALALIAAKKETGIVLDFEPDYAIIVPIHKRFAIPHAIEVLTPPVVDGLEIPCLVAHLLAAIERVDPALHDVLFDNIILIGGSTTTNQFKEKLEKEIESVKPSSKNFSIMDIPERLYLPWIGGSMMAHLPSFKEVWVTHTEFTREGPEIFRREL